MTKIWVIGAQGLLGKALLKQCQARGIDVVGTSKQEADITCLEALQRCAQKIAPSHIVNCAAYTNVDGAETEYERAWSINAQGAEHVALAAREVDARLVHISTDTVFDGTQDRARGEDETTCPVNAYGRSKWEGEQRVQLACVVRTSWLFGSGGKNFLSSLLSALKTKEEMRIVADQWGKVTYAPDLAHAVLDLLDASGIYHFANAGVVSRYELAQGLFEELCGRGTPLVCKHVHPVGKEAFPLPAPRPTYSILSTDKYTHVTGKEPRHWKEALASFLDEVSHAL